MVRLADLKKPSKLNSRTENKWHMHVMNLYYYTTILSKTGISDWYMQYISVPKPQLENQITFSKNKVQTEQNHLSHFFFPVLVLCSVLVGNMKDTLLEYLFHLKTEETYSQMLIYIDESIVLCNFFYYYFINIIWKNKIWFCYSLFGCSCTIHRTNIVNLHNIYIAKQSSIVIRLEKMIKNLQQRGRKGGTMPWKDREAYEFKQNVVYVK